MSAPPHSSKGKVIMGIIAFLILGLICAAIAKAVLPGKDPGGILVTLVIGVVGALLGGFLAGTLLGADPMDEFWDVSSWLCAIVGSLLVLLVWRLVARRA
jgi:uncharacterized membrane protein YeaQ/YmgE (transglycosylase-associated protein family)